MVEKELGQDHPLLQKIEKIRSLISEGIINEEYTTIGFSDGTAVIEIPKKTYTVDLEKGKISLSSGGIVEKCFKKGHEVYVEALLMLLIQDFKDFSSFEDGS